MNNNNNKRALKPSQRDSITDFNASFGNENRYKNRIVVKKTTRIIIFVLSIIILIYIGFFFTELLISITELPACVRIITKETVTWISSPIIQG